MRTNSEQLSPAKTLLLHWRALWAMAYAFAKTMTLAERRDPRRAAEKAEMLEVWSRVALVTLLGQIAALEAGGHTQAQEDDTALAQCRAIVGALAMLCAVAAKVKCACLERTESVARAEPRRCAGSHDLPRATVYVVDYLDSS